MKKPWVAFLLNFLFPGAGLAYLGKWGWAVLNLVGVVILAVILGAVVPPDSLGAVSAGLGAASGSLAMSLAGAVNAKANARPLVGPPPSAPIAWSAAVPAAPVSTAPPISNVLPTSKKKFCGACGAQVTSSKFCGTCGSPIRQANQCPACGCVLDTPSQFCTECGHAMA